MDFSSAIEYVTGQSIDLKTFSQDHNAAIEEELETLRSEVDRLTDEVGSLLLSPSPAPDATFNLKRNHLRSEVDQQAAEINTLESLTKAPVPTQKNSGKPGQEVNSVPPVSPNVDR